MLANVRYLYNGQDRVSKMYYGSELIYENLASIQNFLTEFVNAGKPIYNDNGKTKCTYTVNDNGTLTVVVTANSYSATLNFADRTSGIYMAAVAPNTRYKLTFVSDNAAMSECAVYEQTNSSCKNYNATNDTIRDVFMFTTKSTTKFLTFNVGTCKNGTITFSNIILEKM